MLSRVVRASGLLTIVGAVGVLASVQLDLGMGPAYVGSVLVLVAGVGSHLVGVRRQRPGGADASDAERVRPPFRGRWLALNSPASKVPSHGTHHLAQTYAVDLIHQPDGAPERRTDPVWPLARRPHDYASFGEHLLAPFEGTVVAVQDRRRDHLTRTSVPGLIYLVLEGFVRSLLPASHLLGNHVVVRCRTTGSHALLAHARRGSVRVAVGDEVAAGDVVADCGNSGNSSEPHLHFQLMSGPDPLTAVGRPFAWATATEPGTIAWAVPGNGETFDADTRKLA